MPHPGSCGEDRLSRWRPPARVRRPVVVLVGLVAACGAAQDCTSIGCTGGLVIKAPGAEVDLSAGTLTVCVDDECKERDVTAAGPVEVTVLEVADLAAGDEVRATLVLPDGRRYGGEAVAMRDRPNGSGCEPTCIDATITLAR